MWTVSDTIEPVAQLTCERQIALMSAVVSRGASSPTMITLAADVGGTFTDLILVDTARSLVLVDKVPSGRRGSAGAIAPGIGRIAQRAGCRPSDIALFVHGFTVPTNAFLMRTGARAVLVTSRGNADVLEIGNQLRPKTYALIQTKPRPVIPRERVVEAAERIDAFGGVVEALTAAGTARVVAQAKALAPESIAISLMFSFLQPRHELALAAALKAAMPGVPVYCSHVVNPQLEEWPRASTTAMAAYVGPVVTRYVDELEATLAGLGFRGTLRLMRSDGGVATPRAARENPGHMLTSGLAGGVIASVELCRRLGVEGAVTLDVGGTSADFSAIVGGKARSRMARTLDGQPVRLPTIDVETMSNGGGTIAWVDPGGALRVGPLSAGAVPGPACYGAGGDKPTVTDAAVVLGWLAAEDYLGGEVRIEPGLARDVVERELARPLGLSVEDAAFGIIRIANAQLVQSIRTLCVERGLDARDLALVAFGGAGPLYGGMIARDLGMAEVIVPCHPGVFAAEGLLAADIKHVAQVPFRAGVDGLEAGRLATTLREMREKADAELATDGVPGDRRAFRFLGDLRYIGQFHEILVELPDDVSAAYDERALSAAFHRQHETTYGHADPKAPVEIVNLRIEATGRLDTPEVPDDAPRGTARLEAARRRRVVLAAGAAPLEVPIYDRASLVRGHRLEGPAIIAQLDTTTVVLAGQTAEVGAHGTLRIRESKA